MPSSPPCLCGTSSSDPLHIVIRGRPLRASGRQTVGIEGSGARPGTRRANSNSRTCPIVPGVGGMESRANEWQWVHQALPVRLFFSPSYPLRVVPSSAPLFALAGCHREGPLHCCLCNLLGNFQGHTISPLLFHLRSSHLLPKIILMWMLHVVWNVVGGKKGILFFSLWRQHLSGEDTERSFNVRSVTGFVLHL